MMCLPFAAGAQDLPGFDRDTLGSPEAASAAEKARETAARAREQGGQRAADLEAVQRQLEAQVHAAREAAARLENREVLRLQMESAKATAQADTHTAARVRAVLEAIITPTSTPAPIPTGDGAYVPGIIARWLGALELDRLIPNVPTPNAEELVKKYTAPGEASPAEVQGEFGKLYVNASRVSESIQDFNPKNERPFASRISRHIRNAKGGVPLPSRAEVRARNEQLAERQPGVKEISSDKMMELQKRFAEKQPTPVSDPKPSYMRALPDCTKSETQTVSFDSKGPPKKLVRVDNLFVRAASVPKNPQAVYGRYVVVYPYSPPPEDDPKNSRLSAHMFDVRCLPTRITATSEAVHVRTGANALSNLDEDPNRPD